ncbi:hypothetical protein M404DRAFT_34077 [Pisolithus tinctorius Marx 270]|uniref:Uncharacterized protein n=1 Tax=Pisolithus tinctorius Marx 270 TaxID=870435 RepID=A0A0C3N3A8_PISTI|nr:hypothetical protein M404DRAFT_34077 [Pisolithus tinctorius Marx 270]
MPLEYWKGVAKQNNGSNYAKWHAPNCCIHHKTRGLHVDTSRQPATRRSPLELEIADRSPVKIRVGYSLIRGLTNQFRRVLIPGPEAFARLGSRARVTNSLQQLNPDPHIRQDAEDMRAPRRWATVFPTIGRDALQRVVRTASSMQAAVLIRNWAPSDVAEIRIVRVDHPNPRKTANDAHF